MALRLSRFAVVVILTLGAAPQAVAENNIDIRGKVVELLELTHVTSDNPVRPNQRMQPTRARSI